MSEFAELAEASAETSSVADATSVTVEDALVITRPGLRVDPEAIDQADWSDARRQAYRETAAAGGELLGVLSIPRLSLRAPILVGIDDAALDAGVGWMDRTAAPGENGNAAIAGHRDSFFRSLGELENGDEIVVDTGTETFTYQVEYATIVEPTDVSVIAAVPGRRLLTLITCYPFYFAGPAPKRYVIRASLPETASSPGN